MDENFFIQLVQIVGLGGAVVLGGVWIAMSLQRRETSAQEAISKLAQDSSTQNSNLMKENKDLSVKVEALDGKYNTLEIAYEKDQEIFRKDRELFELRQRQYTYQMKKVSRQLSQQRTEIDRLSEILILREQDNSELEEKVVVLTGERDAALKNAARYKAAGERLYKAYKKQQRQLDKQGGKIIELQTAVQTLMDKAS